MANSKSKINKENFNEWLASTGYLFPSNYQELEIFERLFSDYEFEIDPESIDPEKIISGTYDKKTPIIDIKANEASEYSKFKIAARNFDNLPEHIITKIKKNQDESDKKETGSKE